MVKGLSPSGEAAYPGDMHRRVFLALGLAGLASPGPAQNAGPEGAPTPAARLGISGGAAFADWFNGFYAQALAAGLNSTVLDDALYGLSPDPTVTSLDVRQPEFSRPVGDYVRNAVNDERVIIGRQKMASIPALESIELAWGVPREVLVAIWAMESRFGARMGDMDIIRCFATLAAQGRRRAWAEHELIAALTIISRGEATRPRLRGSWAGAMGQTQMLPSTFLSAAADGDGDGRKDIWDSAPDALASAANLLVRGGWRRDEGWAREVILPAGFDYNLAEAPGETADIWTGRGAVRADGLAWTEADAAAPAVLLLPAGASGPALLALPNHFAIRTYNNALAYALAVGFLADRFAGGRGLVTPWPPEIPLSLDDRVSAQSALSRLGFSPGSADGVLGMGTRKALRAWQKSQGLPADGYLSPDMVRRLKAAIAAPPPQTLTPS